MRIRPFAASIGPRGGRAAFLATLLAACLGRSSALEAADGTWTGAGGTPLWSTPGNWLGDEIADGAGFGGFFNGLDLVADSTVALDAPRTLGGLAFGDLDPATPGGWTLTNGGSAANVLTLAGGQPTITVGGLGTGRIAEVTAALAGSAGLVKSGAGQLRLSATNSYTGGTTISGGTLWITADGQLGGAAAITIENGAALRLGNNATGTNTTLAAGRGIVLGAGTQTLIKDTRRTVRIDGVISGTGGLIFDDSTAAGGDGGGGGRYQLYGANTYEGETRIVYRGIKDPGVFLYNKLALQNTTLNYNTTDATAADLLWFSGGVTNYTDGFTLGGLRGDKNLNLSPQGNSAKNLRIGNNNASTTYTGVISSSNDAAAGITKIGGGVLELTRVHTFAGPTRVEGGVLAITGSGSLNGGSGVTIAGGTLRYSSSTNLTKPLTFTGGGIGGTNWGGSLDGLAIGAERSIAPGTATGTATTGSQTWAAGGTYVWEMNLASGTAGASAGWDLVSGTGTLAISATSFDPFTIDLVSLAPGGSAGPVVDFDDLVESAWKIADFGNPVAGFDPEAFAVGTARFANQPAGFFEVTLGSAPGIGGDDSQIYLRYSPGQPVAALDWYGDGAAPGGSGTWSATQASWHDAAGARTWSSRAEARFPAPAGTVTIAAAGVGAAGGLAFAADGYVVSGGRLTLSAPTAAGNAIEVAEGATATIDAVIDGTQGMTKTGGGRLALAADAAYAGGTTVAAGVLAIGAGGTAGSVAGPIEVEMGAALLFDRSDQLVVGNAISGAGRVVQAGPGITRLVGTNFLFTGPTEVESGTLEIVAPYALAFSPVTVAEGAMLAVADGTTMAAPAVTLSGGTLSAASLLIDETVGIGALTINGGTLAGSPAVTVGGGLLALAETSRGVVDVGSLAVAGTGLVDLGSGGLSIAAGGVSPEALRELIIQGRGSGSWDGSAGITSRAAAAAPGVRAVGYRVDGDGAVFVSFAAPGDVNLDGLVDSLDIVTIAASGTFGTGLPSVWSQGDVNYDGVTDSFDIVAIAASGVFGQGSYFPAPPTLLPAVVPEPGLAIVLPILLVGGWLGRFRRRGTPESVTACPGSAPNPR